MQRFTSLAYDGPESLVFGLSPRPLECGHGGLKIGGGLVFPEVNFTLPGMHVTRDNFEKVTEEYTGMIVSVIERLVDLGAPGAVIEIEHPPQLTRMVDLGVEITRLAAQALDAAYEEQGLRSALRITPCDIRDIVRPPELRSGEAAAQVLKAFRMNAQAGADLLSIESTGGKEISDRALTEGNVPGLLFALGVLAPRDMHFLWSEIVTICEEEGVVPAGDTACAFGNTAMILADQKMIPVTLAAVVRAMSAVRSLVAFEEGALGPSKDCAYEGPIIKAITGLPISMEGKSSACAHFSHVGNVAAACCDLWSNESVQNVRLLSGFAPEVFTEILEYDCRLMNQASASDQRLWYRDLMVQSDAGRSLHAAVITPRASFRLAEAIVKEPTDYLRTRAAGLEGCRIIRDSIEQGVAVSDRELIWLDRIESELEQWSSEDDLVAEMSREFSGAFHPGEYGLDGAS
jgi:methanol--5-hydroxybenzimidazolylcobamide Co-methyltransferase